MLTTFGSTTNLLDVSNSTEAVRESAAKLIDSITAPRGFETRLVAFERAVRAALPPKITKLGPVAKLTPVVELDAVLAELKPVAKDALQLAVDEAKAAGALWDQLGEILNVRAKHVGDAHRAWSIQNQDRALVHYGSTGRLRRMFVAKTTDVSETVALKRVERAGLVQEAHERCSELVRGELWRLVDLALASKHPYVEISEATGFSEGWLHSGHANWAAMNHRTARVQARPYDERRALVMEALRAWAAENGGALPTGLKMWNDVPVGKKQWDPKIAELLRRAPAEVERQMNQLAEMAKKGESK